MGREIKITCDSCGKDIHGGEYMTLKPTRVKGGKQYKFCTIWLCRDCFNETKLKMLLFTGEEEKKEK